jgi:hemoglobin
MRWPALALASLLTLTLASLESGCASGPLGMASSAPLYQQLGGVDNITRFSDRTMDRVAQDPRTRRTFEGVKMPYLKASVSAYICKVADGPCVYEGQDMKKSHADLKLGGSEFELMVTVLREELDAAGVPTAAKNELLRRLAPSKRDIVTH